MSAHEYPFVICDGDDEIDRAGNVDTVESVLYGDLTYHSGSVRIVWVPEGDEFDYPAAQIETLARINADCWNIPLDIVKRGTP